MRRRSESPAVGSGGSLEEPGEEIQRPPLEENELGETTRFKLIYETVCRNLKKLMGQAHKTRGGAWGYAERRIAPH
jgi:hypothetical protein